MNIHQKQGGRRLVWAVLVCMALFMAGCADAATPGGTAVSNPAPSVTEQAHEAPAELLPLPDLEAAPLAGKPLQVVATTSIIGDVVAQVGGEAIDLTTLMSAGQDPHSYQSGARGVNGRCRRSRHLCQRLGFGRRPGEESKKKLAAASPSSPFPPISSPGLGADEHGHADPHVWFSIDNVVQWSDNVAHVLSALDPANAPTYAANAAAYQAELAELAAATETQLAQIPAEKRFLITNHDSLRYFADRYGFTLLGAVIPRF
ncbi:MAG: metal ABC transporter substrate-binding protein [Chloroflexi bacterium]|nr:metal ABC transporter substrate-binding protein [Chloroflexota bacterium]